MISPDATRRLWSLGLFALPLVAVKLAAMMMGGTSQQAGAAAQPAASEATDAVAAATRGVSKVEWTPEQRTAAAHVRELASTPFGPSPMLFYAPSDPVLPAPGPVEVPTIVPDEPQPQFVLQAVMIAPNANKALINGRMYESGEDIEEGDWMVGEININERCVTLHNTETHGIIVIRVKRPR